MDGVGGLEGWRWIFILEGIATILASDECAFVVFRPKYQRQRSVKGEEEEASQTRVAVADEFKWASQLLTIPIYTTDAILAVIIKWTSDWVGKRSLFIVVFLWTIICISSGTPKVVYGGVFIATRAIYPAFPDVISWLASNLSGSYKRNVGMAIQIGVGNLLAMASNFYRSKDGPRYKLAHALEIDFIRAGNVAALILIIGYDPIYKGRSRKVAVGDHNQYSEMELSANGDKALTWRYMH
ncbi:hypothetical protein FBEOM_11345 [Fusarium beomiforme]|uniref:Major facilitator superfamily (MFS) profile domain-containing protein n=1 Tax=Fusarium beomiforme TaxID=44412 RepID=A0A9P5DU27_9HYPO|nr:hypothetical protein FBEOM_11345 [Fusarium beomiforme]